MARLSKKTVQRLAVLRALVNWSNGAYGPLRVHKTLFFTDMNYQKKLFTYKKYHYGQYSEDITAALNALRAAGILQCIFDGPAERLRVAIPGKTKRQVERLFEQRFPLWERSFQRSFREWGHLRNSTIIDRARSDETYKKFGHNEVIFKGTLPDVVNIPELDAASAERLSDLVDERLNEQIRDKLMQAVRKVAVRVDWRQRYFAAHCA